MPILNINNIAEEFHLAFKTLNQEGTKIYFIPNHYKNKKLLDSIVVKCHDDEAPSNWIRAAVCKLLKEFAALDLSNLDQDYLDQEIIHSIQIDRVTDHYWDNQRDWVKQHWSYCDQAMAEQGGDYRNYHTLLRDGQIEHVKVIGYILLAEIQKIIEADEDENTCSWQ